MRFAVSPVAAFCRFDGGFIFVAVWIIKFTMSKKVGIRT